MRSWGGLPATRPLPPCARLLRQGSDARRLCRAGGEAAESPKEEKTEFNLRLESYDAASKIKVIKEIRSITDLGLKEAKELVRGVVEKRGGELAPVG